MYRHTKQESDDNDKNKMQQIVTKQLLDEFYLIIKNLKESIQLISVDQFFKLWYVLAQSYVSKNKEEDKTQFPEAGDLSLLGLEKILISNQQAIREFLVHYADSIQEPNILIDRIGRLLKPEKMYNEETLVMLSHLNIPWILKGITKHQQKLGAMVIGGMSIPKQLLVDDKKIVKKNLDEPRLEIKDLNHQYENVMSLLARLATVVEVNVPSFQVLKEKIEDKQNFI